MGMVLLKDNKSGGVNSVNLGQDYPTTKVWIIRLWNLTTNKKNFVAQQYDPNEWIPTTKCSWIDNLGFRSIDKGN
jgi:hypothetical protein